MKTETKKRKNKRRKLLQKKYSIEILFILLGCLCLAIATSLFLLPNQLSAGGFAGIATVVYYLFKIPLGTVMLVLNIPLFIFGYIKVGKDFFFKSLLGTISYAVFADLLDRIPAVTQDSLLACIYGGIFMGIGTGLILKVSASTGGSDLLSYLIRVYKPQLKSGNIIAAIDIVIVIINTIFFRQIEVALYSAIAIFLMNKIIDIVFEGVKYTKSMYIISPKYETIAQQISKKVNRGSTGIAIKGMFHQDDGIMLLCVGSRTEVDHMRHIALRIDPTAFILIVDAREAWGKGFKLDRQMGKSNG